MNRLAQGQPVAFVAALAAVVLVAILVAVASKEHREIRAYAEVTLSPSGCLIDPRREFNSSSCERVGPGQYRVKFTKPLGGSTIIASRGTCCPGSVRASIDSADSALIVVERRVRGAIRASVVVP